MYSIGQDQLYCMYGKGDSYGTTSLVCPCCNSWYFHTRVLEDINKKTENPSWWGKVATAFKCANCSFKWDSEKGCPNKVCKTMPCSSGRGKLVSDYPQSVSEYVVLPEQGKYKTS